MRRTTHIIPRTRWIRFHIIAHSDQRLPIADNPVIEATLPEGHLTWRCEARNHPRRALFRPADDLTKVGRSAIDWQQENDRVYVFRHNHKRIYINTGESLGHAQPVFVDNATPVGEQDPGARRCPENRNAVARHHRHEIRVRPRIIVGPPTEMFPNSKFVHHETMYDRAK